MVHQSQFIEMSKHGCSKRQLGSLFCSIRNGANIKQGVKSGGFPITRIETIAEGYVDRSKMGYAGIEDNSYSGYYLQNYDILMSHINSMKHIGKTAIYRQSIGETVIHGMNLLCLRLKEGVANPMYVLYLLQSDDIRTEIRLISKQAVNQASFTVSDLKTIEITLPSMSVQNQFEVVVNQADKSKFAGLKSQFIEMFGNDSIGNCKWPTKSFGELFEISSSRRILKDDWAQEGVPFLRVRDLIYYSQTGELKNEFFVSESFYNKLKDADGRVQEGDILVSATSTIGKCMVVKNGERYYYKDADVLRFREKAPVNKVFFVYGLSMPTVENQINDTIGKTTVGHFLISKAATIKQPLPPTQLQESFERIVKQADKSKFAGLKSQFIEETKLWENEGTIRDLIHNTVEKAGKKYSADSKIRYIDISSVDNETNTVTGVTEYIFKDAPSRAQQCVKKGDILVSTVRPNLKNIAVNHLDGEDLVASSGFCVLRPKEGCAGLIMAYILSDVFTEKMTLVAKGTNYPAIHDSDILDYKIQLPEDSKVSMIDRLFRQADKSKYLS